MENIEGSMVEGYIVYDSFYYANEYIKQIYDTQGPIVWEEALDEGRGSTPNKWKNVHDKE